MTSKCPKIRVEPRVAGRWLHCKILNILTSFLCSDKSLDHGNLQSPSSPLMQSRVTQCSPPPHGCFKPAYISQGLFTWPGEDRRKRNNLHSVYMQTFWSVWFTVDKKLKIKDYPCTERHAAIFVWFVPSTRRFLVRAVYTVLGSSYLSARKILKTENIGRQIG